MTISKFTYRWPFALLFCFLQMAAIELCAQNETAKADTANIPKARKHRLGVNRGAMDSLTLDSLIKINNENYEKIETPVQANKLQPITDTIQIKTEQKSWIPNSTRAVWLATVIPGGGQIYNRKYWKLPIVYGGFVGCAYALSWNGKMYRDYSQAYLDIMDKDPKTNSYINLLPANFDFAAKEQWLKDTLKKNKDFHRRNRDLSIFAFIGVYLISIIDAYVDAELSSFDISPDLGLRIEPAVINDKHNRSNSLGFQCSIKF